MCVCDRGREKVCVCVCVCVCERERERENVCERERVRERACASSPVQHVLLFAMCLPPLLDLVVEQDAVTLEVLGRIITLLPTCVRLVSWRLCNSSLITELRVTEGEVTLRPACFRGVLKKWVVAEV